MKYSAQIDITKQPNKKSQTIRIMETDYINGKLLISLDEALKNYPQNKDNCILKILSITDNEIAFQTGDTNLKKYKLKLNQKINIEINNDSYEIKLTKIHTKT